MSTAKSMATQYLNAKRANGSSKPAASRFKSSTSNLVSSGQQQTTSSNKSRLMSTSMTNLSANQHNQNSRITRPASRNALDSIHMGMNAKYAQVQSKVLLHNIRPQPNNNNNNEQTPINSTSQQIKQSKIPATNNASSSRHGTLTPTTTSSIYATAAAARKTTSTPTGGARIQQSDRSQLINKIKSLQEELDKQEQLREELKQELEREKADKLEQVQQIKLELQEKVGEHERQNEDYHQKLLEAYELADQNRRAADNILNESRQRDEESRKRIEELEQQLAELKEFVSMKEEMAGKMSELREQIREERERYEEKTRSLNQMFENEKISLHVDQNSNYFRRVKPSLQSVESVDKLTADGQQQVGQQPGHLLHRSEHDMYGSKLSTRMQDTAKSAWKASRKFANSVITGGVGGLSACRQCTKKRSSGASLASSASSGNVNPVTVACGSAHQQGHLQQQAVCVPASNSDHVDGHLTSVVEVGKAGDHLQAQMHSQQQPVVVQPTTSASAQHPPSSSPITPAAGTTTNNEGQCGSHQQQAQQSLIRVDQNNKLTIVTKFNDSDCHLSSSSSSSSSQHSASNLNDSSAPASSSGCESERSRCESSSSGRGTASDAGSSGASQNGDSDGLEAPKSPVNATNSNINGTLINGHQQQQDNYADQHGQPISPTVSQASDQKRHKRKSSLFKASKVFGGSQVSLNKLRSFFAVASAKSNSSVGGTNNSNYNHKTEPHQTLPYHQTNSFFARVINQSLPSPPFEQNSDRVHQGQVNSIADRTKLDDNVSRDVKSCQDHSSAIDDYDNPQTKLTGQNSPTTDQQQVGQGEALSASLSPASPNDKQTMQKQQQVDVATDKQVPTIQIQLMEKVRQVGESYELNKYKTLNRTIELDARLANDRLLATKLRLNQVNSANEKLNKQLRLAQQQVRDQEKKILVTETMLRQFVGDAGVQLAATTNKAAAHPTGASSLSSSSKQTNTSGGPKWSRSNRLAGRFGGGANKKSSTSGGQTSRAAGSKQTSASTNEANEPANRSQQQQQVASMSSRLESAAGGGGGGSGGSGSGAPKSNDNKTNYENSARKATVMAALKSQQSSSGGQPRQVSSSATQTAQPSRARTIINELRQRLNLAVGAGAGSPATAKVSALAVDTKKPLELDDSDKHDVAIQTPNNDTTNDNDYDEEEEEADEEDDNDDEEDLEFRYEQDSDYVDDDGHYLSSYHLLAGDLTDRAGQGPAAGGRRKKSSNRRLRASHEARLRRRRVSFIKRRSISLDAILNNSLVHELPETGEQIIISRGWPAAKQQQLRRSPGARRKSRSLASPRDHQHARRHHRQHQHHYHSHHSGDQHRRRGGAPGPRQRISQEQKRRLLVEFLRQTNGIEEVQVAAGTKVNNTNAGPIDPSAKRADDGPPGERAQVAASARDAKQLIVEYDLPTHSGGPIELDEPRNK